MPRPPPAGSRLLARALRLPHQRVWRAGAEGPGVCADWAAHDRAGRGRWGAGALGRRGWVQAARRLPQAGRPGTRAQQAAGERLLLAPATRAAAAACVDRSAHSAAPRRWLHPAGAQYRLRPEDRAVLWRDFVPWAVRAGLRCPDLLCLHYERHLADDLHELRARWRVLTAPQPPAHLLPRLEGRRPAAEPGDEAAGGAGAGQA
jgi:hypothetical protein